MSTPCTKTCAKIADALVPGCLACPARSAAHRRFPHTRLAGCGACARRRGVFFHPARTGTDPHPAPRAARPGRSDGHTSELQSLMRISFAVFVLKKKKQSP